MATKLSAAERAGAQAEATARDEGLSKAAREVRDTLEALARRPRYRHASQAELVEVLASIYRPPRRWGALFGGR